MPVMLATTGQSPATHYDRWFGIQGAYGGQPDRHMDSKDVGLAATYDEVATQWWQIARDLADDPGATYAHTPACASNSSDFGLMLAWTAVVRRLAEQPPMTLILCDDPWLFRHLATLPGVSAKAAPPLWGIRSKLFLRGLAARLKVSTRMAWAALTLRNMRSQSRPEAPTLLVYGHPASSSDGYDAYFGTLPQDFPNLQRVLHVDCPPRRARELAMDGHTTSLHAWGSAITALGLWRARWQPRSRNWLIQRSADLESGTGQGAMIRWQIYCQSQWLALARPSVVAWPWENHSWERAFVSAARRRGVQTVGYQHTVIGRHEWNHAGFAQTPATLPDRIACGGAFYADMLATWGIPVDRLVVAGAWRFPTIRPLRWNREAPTFVALPAIRGIAEELMAAITALAAQGHSFVVREHPMTPVGFAEGPGMARAAGPLSSMSEVRAVIFAATTVGLEAILAGVPTIRFVPTHTVANDVIPLGISVATACADNLAQVLTNAESPPALDQQAFFATVDLAAWERLLRKETTHV